MTDNRWLDSRKIVERIIVQGDLVLEKPAHFGNGDTDAFTDIPLLLDHEKKPLLTGSSIAGALRNYLRGWEFGYLEPVEKLRERDSLAVCLFGGTRGDDEGIQSPLIVDDAQGEMQGIELRDGVKISPVTRTAEDKHKFDIELLEAGTTFSLRFELLVSKDSVRNRLLSALALALGGLERGEIALGKRKSRGYGRCKVSKWTVTAYDFKKLDHFLAWLTAERGWKERPSVEPREGKPIAVLLGVLDELKQREFRDHRKFFKLSACFQLDGSLLIRSGAGPEKPQKDQPQDEPIKEEGPLPDAVHLHSKQVSSESEAPRQPVLPGTSVAGVLRHRALRIAQTLAGRNGKARELVEKMFGQERRNQEDETTLWSSRVIVEETPINGGHLLVQNRIRIDRFTAGAYKGALFNEAPIFSGSVKVELKLNNPQPEEIGLLLLLLKDLWANDLPIGGESSIGRGRLCGKEATLEYKSPDSAESSRWRIVEQEGQLQITGDKEDLEGYVGSLREVLARAGRPSADSAEASRKAARSAS